MLKSPGILWLFGKNFSDGLEQQLANFLKGQIVNIFKKIVLIFIGIYLLYNIVLILLQQSESAIYLHM